VFGEDTDGCKRARNNQGRLSAPILLDSRLGVKFSAASACSPLAAFA
jgi:hypothetical protein